MEGVGNVSGRWTVDAGLPSKSADRDTRVLLHVAAFRVVLERDLVGAYEGMAGLTRARWRMTQRGVVRATSTRAGRLWTVTPSGLTEVERVSEARQRLYAGVRRRRDLAHDAGVWRVFQWACLHLAERGARPVRVMVDAEFRSELARRLLQARGTRPAQLRDMELAGRALGLRVVGGRLPIPDVRVEYVDASGFARAWDLEHVTPYSRPEHIEEKVEAGFMLLGRASRSVAADFGVLPV